MQHNGLQPQLPRLHGICYEPPGQLEAQVKIGAKKTNISKTRSRKRIQNIFRSEFAIIPQVVRNEHLAA